MEARGFHGDMLNGLEDGFPRLLKVTARYGFVGTSEIQGLAGKFARLMDGPEFHDILRRRHGTYVQKRESHAVGTHIERKALKSPGTHEDAQHAHKFLRT